MNANGSSLVGCDDRELLGDLSEMIEAARGRAAAAVNSELVMLYWSVGKRVREHVLGGERAAYGEAVVKRVAAELREKYGRMFDRRSLFRMMRFAELYPVKEIVVPVAPQLTWSNVIQVLGMTDKRQRDFYLAMSARERWSKRTLSAHIEGRLYERTIAARGGVDGLEAEITELRGSGMVAGLVFRDPYVLDFLELLGMDSGDIRAARYLTHDVREQLQRRLASVKLELE